MRQHAGQPNCRQPLRRFVGIDLGVERVPDETTVLKFRHLLVRNDLGKKLFSEVGQVLQASGFQVKTGTIVDATLIGAPSPFKFLCGPKASPAA